ncbi:hypothetical protein SDC9_08010 [bioreactor metagenome]|uniref:Uncharacterized protein n=1 Tax=bioreactor metagenome TaxID=1076179 RepID=A0A644T6A1_9ZZZZ|nr:hypothetical protein [Candidatus Elulimicrobiales bacterium]
MEARLMSNQDLVLEFKKLVILLPSKSLRLLEVEREIAKRIGDEEEEKRLLTNLRNCIHLNKGGVKISECEKEILERLGNKELITSENFQNFWEKLTQEKKGYSYSAEDAGD